MRYLTLAGGTGPEVSALCLGILPFGSTVDDKTSFAVLDRFAEAGGTFVDTANNYSIWAPGGTGNESEELLGRWMRSRGRRESTVVATKVGARPDPARGSEWPANWEGLAAGTVRTGIEGSLRRLGTDRIDLYYAHIEDRTVPMEETVGAFAELVAEGGVGVLGCSNHASWAVATARQYAADRGLARYSCVQQRYTYLQPRPGAGFGTQGHRGYAGVDLVEYIDTQEDMTLLAYGSLIHGAYTRDDKRILEQYDHPGTERRLGALREVAKETGATPNQVVLAWLMGAAKPVIPVLGVSSVAQLEEALGAVDLQLAPELRAKLDAA
ncbi:MULTISPECIES: aldo/keto reductase [unclassified Streptomyces]|uniref:aldo/keto reductase n=1 Tax=unclassified Streptomyces TaxID=2593676 RepID=UPI00336A81EC